MSKGPGGGAVTHLLLGVGVYVCACVRERARARSVLLRSLVLMVCGSLV